MAFMYRGNPHTGQADGRREWLALLIGNLHEPPKKTGRVKTYLGKSLRAMQGPTFYLRRNL